MSRKIRNLSFTSNTNGRLFFISMVIVAIGAAIGTRLFFLQVIHHTDYLDRLGRQQRFNINAPLARSKIYFQDKNGVLVDAATNQKGWVLYIDTKSLTDPEKVYKALNGVISIDEALFFSVVQKKNDPYEILKRDISLEEGKRILSLNIKGVGLEPIEKRFYPGNELGSHILGFVSNYSGIPSGQYGIEKKFNDALKEHDIILTIEPTVERFIENELKKLEQRWRPDRGGIVIIEPKTGAIRAMVAFPSFNPNDYGSEKDLRVFINPFVEDIYELGSVFKPLTIAGALDMGAVFPTTTYRDTGSIVIGGRTISNFDGKARGERSITQVLEESLNTGAVFTMRKMGSLNLRNYFYNYGLSEKTGIDLPGEVSGNLSNLKNTNREIEFATASFGQGIAVSPIELISALSALGNGGNLIRPYVVASIGEKKLHQNPDIVRRVLKSETSQIISDMLVDVVDVALLGGSVKIPGYRVAAKTGTAQIPDRNEGSSGGYLSDEYLHSFFGYFPARDPQFLIFMFLYRPRGVPYASHSLTQAFHETVEFLINYYAIPPDRS